jgi:hypothetical protein
MEEQGNSWDCMKNVYEVLHSETYKYIYSEPAECAYFGGTYWDVWLMNMMGPGAQYFGCIARITNKDDIDALGYRYRPEFSKKSGVRTGTA